MQLQLCLDPLYSTATMMASRHRAPAAAVLLLLATAVSLLTRASASAAAAECEALGFVAVACSDCDQMAEYVKDGGELRRGCLLASQAGGALS